MSLDATLLTLATGVGDTLKTVMGVVIGLAGMGMLVVGVIAMADKSTQKGITAAVLGVALMVGGLYLTGAL